MLDPDSSLVEIRIQLIGRPMHHVNYSVAQRVGSGQNFIFVQNQSNDIRSYSEAKIVVGPS